MSLTPSRPLKRATEAPTTQQRRPFATPTRTPLGVTVGASGTARAHRHRMYSPSIGTPRTPMNKTLRPGSALRDHGPSLLRREHSVEPSVASGYTFGHEEEQDLLRDFHQNMEVDVIRGLPAGTILGRDAYHQVAVQGNVPQEVRSILYDADYRTEPYKAFIDPMTGFAAVSTPQQVFAWNYAKRSAFSPTCYIFDVPTSTPHVCFIPSQTPQIREPGIILIDSVPADSSGGSGDVTYYENVTLALKNAQAIQGRLGLKDGEYVNGVDRVDASMLLISTSQARVLRQAISTMDGRPKLTLPSPFVKPNNTWLSRSTDVLFANSSRDVGVTGMTIGKEDIDTSLITSSLNGGMGIGLFMGTPRHKNRGIESNVALNGVGMRREVWVAGEGSISGWTLTEDDAKFLKEIPVLSEVAAHPSASGFSQFRLWDIAALESGNVATLISFSLRPKNRSRTVMGPTSYAIAVANPAQPEGLIVSAFIRLQYTSAEDERPLSCARLAVPGRGSVAFVQLSSAIITASLEKDTFYQQSVILKDPKVNPVLGLGFDRNAVMPTYDRRGVNHTAQVTILASRTGLLGVQVDPVKIFDYQPGSTDTARQAQLENKLEQAVFFDGIANPLTFSLSVDSAEDLESAVLAVSELLVTSKSTYLKAQLAVSEQLRERQLRLLHLITIVREMGLLDELSQRSRKKLAEDSTMISVGTALWDLLEMKDRLIQSATRTPLGMLGHIIAHLMEEKGGLDADADSIRSFFLYDVNDIPVILQRTALEASSHYGRLGDSRDSESIQWLTDWILEAGTIFQAAMRPAALDTREDNMLAYEIDQETVDQDVSSYLTDKDTLAGLRYLYERTIDILTVRSEHFGSVIDEETSPDSESNMQEHFEKQLALKSVIKNLAVPVLFALEEQARLEMSIIQRRQDNGAAESSKSRLIEDSHNTIMPLASIDIDFAYEVAEMFEREYTLAQMSVRGDIGSPQRISLYLEGHFGRQNIAHSVHGYRFAQELFAYYLDNKNFHAILQYSTTFTTAVTDFLSKKGRRDLATIHYLMNDDLTAATEQALKASSLEASAHGQTVLLSIAKLATATIAARGETLLGSAFSPMDRELALLQTISELKTRLRGTGTYKEHLRQADAYIKTHLGRFRELGLTSLEELYRQGATSVLQGKSIDRETVIDLLTIKEVNEDEGIDDFVTALKILHDWREHTTFTTRQSTCLETIWRRIYLAEDWGVLDNPALTDKEKQSWLDHTLCLRILKRMRGELPSDCIVAPSKAADIPSEGEVKARFKDTAGLDIAGVYRDLQEEARLLSEVPGLNDTIISELTLKAVASNTAA